MLFNSPLFVVFFGIVAAIFYCTPPRFRWMVLFAASMLFYAAWDYHFLIIFFVLGAVAFVYGRYGVSRGRAALVVAVVLLLMPLAYFKYANFLLANLQPVFAHFGAMPPRPISGIILPLGISFYTFQLLAYCFDVGAGRYGPVESYWKLVLYPMYFPHQIAGPIVRPRQLIPQFTAPQNPDYAVLVSGFRLFLWGLFKKVFVADRLAVFVDSVYSAPGRHHGIACLLALYFFAFQIYCDFSGYSDMAFGASRMLGIELCENFRRPYFSLSLREFWGRWHISLSTWFRDYLYVPLGGNQVSGGRWIFNIMAVFSLSGLWHGANWTFVLWGVYHGALLVAERGIGRLLPTKPGLLWKGLALFVTFHLVVLGWVLFRAPSLAVAADILNNISLTGADQLAQQVMPIFQIKLALAGLAIVVLFDLFAEFDFDLLFDRIPLPCRWGLYYAGMFLIFLFPGTSDIKTFIYFQF